MLKYLVGGAITRQHTGEDAVGSLLLFSISTLWKCVRRMIIFMEALVMFPRSTPIVMRNLTIRMGGSGHVTLVSVSIVYCLYITDILAVYVQISFVKH